jgi:hypothetical protein
MQSIKYLFCGVPGGGTSFTANFLTNCGFICGHEMLDYDVSCKKWNLGPSGNVDYNGSKLIDVALGESSYIAIEWCKFKPMDDIPMIMILRNPIDILNSSVCNCLNNGETIDVGKEIEKILTRFEKIEDRKIFHFRIEYDLEKICGFLNIQYKNPNSTKTRTHNRGRIKFSYEDYAAYPRIEELKKFAVKYDYPIGD